MIPDGNVHVYELVPISRSSRITWYYVEVLSSNVEYRSSILHQVPALILTRYTKPILMDDEGFNHIDSARGSGKPTGDSESETDVDGDSPARDLNSRLDRGRVWQW